MLNSLRSKILLVVSGIILATTMTIMFFAQIETEKSIFITENKSARNLLNTVVLNVENEYQSLVFHKAALLDRRKSELKNITTLAIFYINEFYQKYKQGILSESDAKEQALKGIKKMRYDNDVGYIWINDTKRPLPCMIMHPTLPEFDGKVLDDVKFNCALGIKKNLFQAFVDICLKDGEGYVDYLWPKPTKEGLTEDQPKLSYVRLFREWNWVVGTGVYIDDIEKDAQRRLDAVLVELTQTFSKIKLAQTGYMFLFTGKKEMLIHPTFKEMEIARHTNIATGNLILDDLIRASKTPDQALEYIWNKPPNHINEFRFWKRAYVKYFELLDWYIVSSVYIDEIELPAKLLRKKICYLSIIFLAAALILSLLLSKSLTKPLGKLTLAAKEIEKKGISSAKIPISGTVETIELGLILDKMIQSIKKAGHEKEQLLNALRTSNENLSNFNLKLKNEITERKLAVQELDRLRNLLSNIINSMPSVLIGVDTDGRVTQWNREAEKETGITTDKAQGRILADVFPQLTQHKKKVQQAIQERKPLKDAKVSRECNGQIFFSDITVYPLINNCVEGAVIRVDDVTKRVHIEEMMIQTEKMMSVGGLAAGMAHEINNPLSGILQGIQNISRRISPDLKKNIQTAQECDVDLKKIHFYMEQRKIITFINSIQECGKRVAKIIDNMLCFSRRSESVFIPHDMAGLLDQTVELAASDYNLKKKYDFRHIKIIREYDTETPKVFCDGGKIQQVFLNLLQNGAHAMDENKSREKKSPCFILRIMPEDSMVRIEIQDNGPGIDMVAQKKIFEPFFTTKGVGTGTGLGLSVSYFIITDNHSGSMTVESSPVNGTKFIIWLPIKQC
ncbi:two-component system, NtrC family, sensor kinase [Candidatus Magnetomoraceae bacterium gMMP-1]